MTEEKIQLQGCALQVESILLAMYLFWQKTIPVYMFTNKVDMARGAQVLEENPGELEQDSSTCV